VDREKIGVYSGPNRRVAGFHGRCSADGMGGSSLGESELGSHEAGEGIFKKAGGWTLVASSGVAGKAATVGVGTDDGGTDDAEAGKDRGSEGGGTMVDGVVTRSMFPLRDAVGCCGNEAGVGRMGGGSVLGTVSAESPQVGGSVTDGGEVVGCEGSSRVGGASTGRGKAPAVAPVM
jgi:hypothetical protein